jgi:hypothetical protein
MSFSQAVAALVSLSNSEGSREDGRFGPQALRTLLPAALASADGCLVGVVGCDGCTWVRLCI